MAKAKKQNIFAQYFSNFGLKQLCDIMMLIGGIVLIVGLCTVNVVMTVGLGIYMVATLIAIFRSVRIMLSGINKRSPEYKSALVNVIIMSLIFALALFGFIYSILF